MKLFKYEGYQLHISEEAMLLSPFKTLWKRDHTKDKHIALQELGYIYFMEDPRSDYQIYIDKQERAKQIRAGEGISDDWNPDKAVIAAMDFYASFKSESALLAEDVRAAISNLREYIKTIDLNAVDNNGKPIYTLNTYTAALTQIPKLIVSLDEAEKTISRDVVTSDNVRGATDKAMFEDV